MAEGSGPGKGSAELGRPTASAIILALFLSIGAGIAIGVAYGSGNYWVGTFKTYTTRGLGAMTLVNLLIFSGALYALSRTTRLAVKISQFRSFAFTRIVGGCGGFACIYTAWAAFASWSGQSSALRILPGDVWSRVVASIQEVGGPFMPIVFATEAAALLFLPSRAARRSMTETPYCGPCRRWLTLRKGITSIGYGNVHRLLPLLRKGNLEALAKALPPETTDYVRLDFASCDQCTADGYLSMVRVKDQVDERGHLHHWETTLLQNVQVSGDELKRATGQV